GPRDHARAGIDHDFTTDVGDDRRIGLRGIPLVGVTDPGLLVVADEQAGLDQLTVEQEIFEQNGADRENPLPVSAASRHSAGVVVQSLTWMVLPAGITKPRCLSAESDQSGLFTSYGITRSANFFTSVGFMQPVR